jgi:Na+-transporting NADH:ubiquinone oxidoreductase subunit NqrC
MLMDDKGRSFVDRVLVVVVVVVVVVSPIVATRAGVYPPIQAHKRQGWEINT